MRRQVIYSASRHPVGGAREPTQIPDAATVSASPPERKQRLAKLHALTARHAGVLRFLSGVVFALLLGATYLWSQPDPVPSQEDTDAAVLHTLENRMLPARAAKAAETILPSVVRVRGFVDAGAHKGSPSVRPKHPAREFGQGGTGKQPKGDGLPEGMKESGVGSGVVVVDNGTILTNLHVVHGTKLIRVTFHDGSESDARVVSVHPENDLAVIKAQTIPDDLPAATLGSAGRLKPGDEVVAVGFPFDIGPSVSAGVISGLDREFRSPKGQRVLTSLIQFDAAVNPGNSGGPLVTLQGDVVGIVTAILNPTESGTFIGIGFAVTIGAAGRAVGMHPF